jgi:hypothetical protein
MTTNDRYQQYIMEADAGRVYFFRAQRSDKGTIEHELANMHVISIDSPDVKVLCKSRRHYGISIATVNGHRKLYFLSFTHLIQGVDYLLRAQNFSKRIE